MMATLEAAVPLPDSEMPAKAPRGAPLGKEGALVADLLKLLLKIRAREIDAAARLLARSDELELLAAGVRKGLPMLEGWRYGVFGREALDLVEGKLAFAVVKGRLAMTHVDEIHEEMRIQDNAAAADGEDDDLPVFAEADPEGADDDA